MPKKKVKLEVTPAVVKWARNWDRLDEAKTPIVTAKDLARLHKLFKKTKKPKKARRL